MLLDLACATVGMFCRMALHGVSVSGNSPGQQMVKKVPAGHYAKLAAKCNKERSGYAPKSGKGSDGRSYVEDHE